MNQEKPELYFEHHVEWYDWLLLNHKNYSAVYLIFYKKDSGYPSMTWEEAVRTALCFGWIDATVKSLGNGKRKQYFCKRKPKSPWSALNKKHVSELINLGLMQEDGYKHIEIAKQNGTWSAMDDVENCIIPENLQLAFNKNPRAFENFNNFSKTYKKRYLSWLKTAKREDTKQKRIDEIIRLSALNKKSRL